MKNFHVWSAAFREVSVIRSPALQGASRWFFIVLTAFIFLSCASRPAPIVRIEFWAMGAEGEHVQKLMDQFEKENPDILVDVQSIPWSAAHEKLLTAFAGQSNPDICQLGNTWIPEFQAIGAIRSLDDLLARSQTLDSTQFFPGIWRTNVLAGKTYGIPWYVDTRVLFYRSDLLKRAGYSSPPATWQEWLDVSRKIKELGDVPQPHYGIFLSLIPTDWQVPVILIMQNNGRLLRDNNRYGAFDDPATVEALEFYLKFFQEELAPVRMSEVANIYQGFGSGFFAMMITGPWVVNEMNRRVPDLKGKWDIAPLPAGKNRNSVAGGASLVLFKNSKRTNEAWKLVEFLCRPEIQIEFFRLTRDLPSVLSAWESPVLKNDPQIRAFYQQLNWVMPTPKVVEWEQIATKIQEHLERVVYGKTKLSDAIKNLNRDVDQILEKRRWLLERGLIDF
jgi:multiple sugar transport system substrate-binding protein